MVRRSFAGDEVSRGPRSVVFGRRRFLVRAIATGLALGSGLAGCTLRPDASPSGGGVSPSLPTSSEGTVVPPAQEDPESEFLVDANINMSTIDNWLLRDDVVYRDMRLLFDPARFEDIGGESDLAYALEGFKIVPYPYLGTLQTMPVQGAYAGDALFDVQWNEEGEIVSASERYDQSKQIVEELFPREKIIFLMCGGAGYAMMMKKLLVYLGWDESRIYNIGGAWDYTGYRVVELASRGVDGAMSYYPWRADIATWDFDLLTPVGV